MKISYNGRIEAEVEEEGLDSAKTEGEADGAEEGEENENENGREERAETSKTETKEKTKKKKSNTARPKKTTKKTNTARDLEAEKAKDAEKKLEDERRRNRANAESGWWFNKLDEQRQREKEENDARDEEVELLNHNDGGLTVVGLDESVRKPASQFNKKISDALPAWNSLEKQVYGELKEVKFDCLMCGKNLEDSNQRSTHVKQVHKMKMPKYHRGVLYLLLKKIVEAKKGKQEKVVGEQLEEMVEEQVELVEDVVEKQVEEVVEEQDEVVEEQDELVEEVDPINFVEITSEIEFVDLEAEEGGDEKGDPEVDDVEEILNFTDGEEGDENDTEDKEEEDEYEEDEDKKKDDEDEDNTEEDDETLTEEVPVAEEEDEDEVAEEEEEEEEEEDENEEDDDKKKDDEDEENTEEEDETLTEEVPVAEEEDEEEVAEEDMKEKEGGVVVKANGRRPRRSTRMRMVRRRRVQQNPPIHYEKKKAKVLVFIRKLEEKIESRKLKEKTEGTSSSHENIDVEEDGAESTNASKNDDEIETRGEAGNKDKESSRVIDYVLEEVLVAVEQKVEEEPKEIVDAGKGPVVERELEKIPQQSCVETNELEKFSHEITEDEQENEIESSKREERSVKEAEEGLEEKDEEEKKTCKRTFSESDPALVENPSKKLKPSEDESRKRSEEDNEGDENEEEDVDEINNQNEVDNTGAVSKRELPLEGSPESCSPSPKKAKFDLDEERVDVTNAKEEGVNEGGEEEEKGASPPSLGLDGAVKTEIKEEPTEADDGALETDDKAEEEILMVTLDSDGEEEDEDEDPERRAKRKELIKELRQLDNTKKKKIPRAQLRVPSIKQELGIKTEAPEEAGPSSAPKLRTRQALLRLKHSTSQVKLSRPVFNK